MRADKSPQSHVGPFKHAIDFLVPDGTDVYAALDGTIVDIQERFNQWGPTPDYAQFLNYITIQHGPNEFIQYCHLAKDSVSRENLKVGTQVKQGQKIATVGKTGWTNTDHLHVLAFRRDENPANLWGFKSLKISFV